MWRNLPRVSIRLRRTEAVSRMEKIGNQGLDATAPIVGLTHARRHGGLRRRAAVVTLLGLVTAGVVRASNAWAAGTSIVRLVVGAPPGGSSDLLARRLARDMEPPLGRPVIVENRPGAGGAIAAAFVARAAPDGNTVLLSSSGDAVRQALHPERIIDIRTDFIHVTQVAATTNVLVVHPSLQARSLVALVIEACDHPGRLAYASAGNGSSGHLAMEMLKQRANIDMVHVPYQGGAPAFNEVLSGRVPLMFTNPDQALPWIRRQRVRALAVSSLQRIEVLDSVPTVSECGFPGFEANAWAGLSVPRGTPASRVDALLDAACIAMNGSMRVEESNIGVDVVSSSPERYDAFIRNEVGKWAELIQLTGLALD